MNPLGKILRGRLPVVNDTCRGNRAFVQQDRHPSPPIQSGAFFVIHSPPAALETQRTLRKLDRFPPLRENHRSWIHRIETSPHSKRLDNFQTRNRPPLSRTPLGEDSARFSEIRCAGPFLLTSAFFLA